MISYAAGVRSSRCKTTTPFAIARLGDDVCMVAARGELDGSTAWRLQDALGAATASGARRLIADFAAVTYLDADAVAVLSARARRTSTGRAGASSSSRTTRGCFACSTRTSLEGVVKIEPIAARRRRGERASSTGSRMSVSTEAARTAVAGRHVAAPVPRAQRADPLDRRRRRDRRRRLRVRQRRVLRPSRPCRSTRTRRCVASRRGSS